MSDTTFCIDIGEKYTRLVDVGIKNNKVAISALGYENTVNNYYTDDTEKSIDLQADLLAKIHAELKIGKRNVNVIVPDIYTFSQIIEIAKLNEKELISAIRYQADQFIPMPIDEVDLDIEILKEDKINKKNTILIVASPKKLVERIEATVESAGFVADSLENELSAVGRLFSEVIKPKSKGAYLVVNFGYSSSSIYLIDATSTLMLLTRTIKFGLELFLKELKFNLEIEASKAMEILKTIGMEKNSSYDVFSFTSHLFQQIVDEIKKFILLSKKDYGFDVEKIYIFNHNNSILSFEKKLTEAISITAEPLNIKEMLVENPITKAYSQEMSSFIGAISGGLR